MSPYWRRRGKRHAALAAVSVAVIAGMGTALQARDWWFKLSMASAYVGAALLVATLLLGPWNVLRGRRNPVTTDLRRDVGIWAGVVGLFHLVIGLNVHMRGRPWLYFVYPDKAKAGFPVRHDLFGLTNHAGLLAGLVLLALSNDWAVRRLSAPRWKAIQRWNYLAAALTVLHGFGFQSVEKRALPYVLTLAALAAAALALQMAGFRRVRGGAVEPLHVDIGKVTGPGRRADPD